MTRSERHTEARSDERRRERWRGQCRLIDRRWRERLSGLSLAIRTAPSSCVEHQSFELRDYEAFWRRKEGRNERGRSGGATSQQHPVQHPSNTLPPLPSQLQCCTVFRLSFAGTFGQCRSSLALVSLPLPPWFPSTSPSIHSIEEPAPPDTTLTLPPPSAPRPSMTPRSRTRGRRSLFPPPSRLPLTRAPPALALLPASRPLPSPIALPPPALAPMAAATTKAMTVRVRANSRSHPKTPTHTSVPRPKAPSSAFTPALLTPSTRRSSRTAVHGTGHRHMSSLFLTGDKDGHDVVPSRLRQGQRLAVLSDV